jgi:hypothetical protein
MGLRRFGLLVTVLVFVGCAKPGADVAPVQGHVTLDGKPLAFAILTFQPEGKAPASGGTDKDGHYELMYKRGVMGAPVGPNAVSIQLNVYAGEKGRTLPERYNSQTELVREVKPGPNEINFELTSGDK